MKRRGIRGWTAALALGVCLLLTGCSLSVSSEQLYALPKLPAEYESLEEQINILLDNGAEHAAPASGSNLQSVQMVDLDDDGVEEAVAFFRKADDQKPMKIYFFKSNGDRYTQMALIEGTASSIYSIAYEDLDGDGRREILVGFKSGTEVQVLAVYALRGAEPLNLLTTAYLRYAVSDLDSDGWQELTVFYGGEENRCMADCYVWNQTELSRRSSLSLSFSAAELSRVSAGTLAGGETALYVTGVAADNSVAEYNILTISNGVLRSIVPHASPANGGMFRFLSLYPADVNSSGVTEVPEPSPFPALNEESETYYRILWRDYDMTGASEIVTRTFHNMVDGWSLVLPEAWENTVTLTRRSLPEENVVVFYQRPDGVGVPEPFLAIYAITSDTREHDAVRDGRFVLARQVDTVYAAELLAPESELPPGADEDSLHAGFSLIVAEWTTGDN